MTCKCYGSRWNVHKIDEGAILISNYDTWQNNCCKHDSTNVLQLQYTWNSD
jgi:hypothetical protein